jgi:TonB family protein
VIVWERWKGRSTTHVYVYSKINRNPTFSPNAFVFEPPAGSTASAFDLPRPRPFGTLPIHVGLGYSPPRLLSKKEPKYQTRIQGTVVLYVVIGADGKPSQVLVYRPLSPDLDSAAVRAVRQWRFAPAMSNGQAMAIPATIEVNFRLP